MRLLPCALLLALLLAGPAAAGPLEFNRDIRPLLSEYCFACHGPDTAKRKADLRLDVEEGGRSVVVAGKPEESNLFRRLHDKNPRRRMPPAATGKTLTPAQTALLRRWIEQGAVYQNHWALLPLKRPPLPPVRQERLTRNPVDRFLLARLESEGLTFSPEADRRTLIRRLSFDLTGLPPTPEEIDAFVADPGERAYERLVDRLLASKHYGERMALLWLDLVRYADTGGYHSDNHRDVYLYRDWVIDAFNANQRFDQFTIEQVAGDLLPDATRQQRIASGYNRLLQTTEEGGAQAKEYLAKYASDRVRNASSVWLGLTMGCAECHNHKYDPVSTRDFYRFASFWADVREVAVGRQPQTRLPSPQQEAELKRLDAALAEARRPLTVSTPALEAGQKRWEEKARVETPKGAGRKKDALAQALATPAEKRTAAQKDVLSAHYRTIAPELSAARQRVAELEKQRQAIEAAVPQTLVSMAGPPRVMRVLPRGNWLDDTGEPVTPGTPEALPPLNVQGRRATRLDLARWLVSAEQPLTPRVFVNRLWKLTFGQGLTTSMEDFGSQGSWPSHPELLEWLAVEFREAGWDVKHLLRLLVTSAAYRQGSVGSEALRQADPYNRLLARQGRFRLDAELVRDNALAVSGLLVRTFGGRSVKPYQPAGYWAYLNFPTRSYVADSDANQYRRGLYTYWQRTFPHPSLLAFDAPSREECTADRPRSNTPQQALALLNDPTYVEAARVLAERAIRGGKTDEERLAFAYRQVLGRTPRAQEVGVLLGMLTRHLGQYRADSSAAEGLLGVGLAPVGKDVDRATLAAWTSVSRVLLNLHETITRE